MKYEPRTRVDIKEILENISARLNFKPFVISKLFQIDEKSSFTASNCIIQQHKKVKSWLET